MKRILAIAFLTLATALPVRAADPQAAAKFVAPFLDEQTFAVAHIDLSAINPDSIFDRLSKIGSVPADEIAGPRKMAGEMLAKFRKAGAKDMYVVFSMTDLPMPGPFAVFAAGEGVNEAELSTIVSGLNFETSGVVGSAVVGGTKQQVNRLKTLKPSPRPDLALAFAAAPGSAIQLGLVPTAQQRRIIEEQVRQLPQEVGGGPATILTKGLQWAVLGVETAPKIKVGLTIKSQDAAAATALGDVVKQALGFAAQAGKEMQLDLAALIPVLTPKVDGDRLSLGIREDDEGVIKVLASAVEKMRGAAGRARSVNNLKQMALAMHNYLDSNGTFPATGSQDKDGKSLLSWRVHILPFIEQDNLYKQFKLDEPWDSEHNKALIAKMPEIYKSPGQRVGDGKTTYLAPMGKDTIIAPGAKGSRIQDITDGTSNTILLVESGDDAAVIWTKPDDLDVLAADVLKKLLGHWNGAGFNAAFGDGSVRFIGKTIDAKTLAALFTRNGGEVIANIP